MSIYEASSIPVPSGHIFPVVGMLTVKVSSQRLVTAVQSFNKGVNRTDHLDHAPSKYAFTVQFLASKLETWMFLLMMLLPCPFRLEKLGVAFGDFTSELWPLE